MHDSPEQQRDPLVGRDKRLVDSGWGVKPDDQPANASEAPSDAIRSYPYKADDGQAVRAILTRQRQSFSRADRVIVQPGRTIIVDIHGDQFVVEGLSFGDEALIELLKALGAAFEPARLRELDREYDGTRQYSLTRAWAWGAERTG